MEPLQKNKLYRWLQINKENWMQIRLSKDYFYRDTLKKKIKFYFFMSYLVNIYKKCWTNFVKKISYLPLLFSYMLNLYHYPLVFILNLNSFSPALLFMVENYKHICLSTFLTILLLTLTFRSLSLSVSI